MPSLALALWSKAETRSLVSELSAAGIPVLSLKGPSLQERLHRDAAAYVSGDVDVLVPRRAASRARAVLERAGWTFEPTNGFLWRLSAAATYERNRFRVDLHWGLHAAHLPAWTLRSLEEAMWRGATRSDSGMLEPSPEALYVFLALHAAGHDPTRREWVRNVELARDRVEHWDAVWEIAREARVSAVVRAATARRSSRSLLDGPVGNLLWYSTFILRGHVVPRSVRDQMRERWALHRQGYGWRAVGFTRVEFEGMDLEIDQGVFPPQGVSSGIVERARECYVADRPPVIVEIGTGSGAVSFHAKKVWPTALVFATDYSGRAIACARRNAARLGDESISFLAGSLTDPLPASINRRVDLLFSNVPYVSRLGGQVAGDLDAPDGAVYGPDPDGLGLMRDLARDALSLLRPGGC